MAANSARFDLTARQPIDPSDLNCSRFDHIVMLCMPLRAAPSHVMMLWSIRIASAFNQLTALSNDVFSAKH
jgi:hypothetical protein